jgi:hypothetical protein
MTGPNKESKMRKLALTGSLAALLTLALVIPASGHSRRYQPNKNYLTFSFVINPSQFGYKHHLGKNLYATGDMVYQHDQNDLLFRVGGAYYIPVRVLFFRFYGSTGYQFARDRGNEYPYMAVGTHFWFLYTEILHPIQSGATPEYRLGFQVKF